MPQLPQLTREQRAATGDAVGATEPTSVELRQERAAVVEQMRTITETCEQANRSLTADEHTTYEAHRRNFNDLTERITRTEEREQREAAAAVSIGRPHGTGDMSRLPGQRSRQAVRLTRDQRVSDYVRDRGHQIEGQPSFDRMVRGMLTGDWSGAELERRTLMEGSAGAGGVMVPTPVAAEVIDLARAQTRVMQAGATTIPMESSTLKVPKQISDPSVGWYQETDTMSESDLSFDAVEMQAHTMRVLVKASLELLEDVDNTEDIITRSTASAMALELDRVALRGSGTAPEPLGLRNTSGVTVEDLGTDGEAPTWSHLARGVGALRADNFEPGAAILHPRTETDLTEQKDTTGQYVSAPASLAGVQRLMTTQVPTDLTLGSSTNASEVYMGQWSELLLGIRTSFTLRPLTERFVDSGEVGFFAHLRADVAVARPGAFYVANGVIPAS